MKIVVLAGGLSAEREVSLSSGSKICKALRSAGHQTVLVDLFFGVEQLPEHMEDAFAGGFTNETYAIRQEAPDIAAVRTSRPERGLGAIGPNVVQLCRAADMVYMGLHGENGENGRIQAFLDVLEIPYTASGYLACALAMNKELSKQIFHRHGIPVPQGISLRRGEDAAPAESLGFPCIVKPCSGGSSIGLYLAENASALRSALASAFALEDEVLVERFVKGREFSVGVLDGKALPPIEIIPRGGIYDYAHKYQPGWTEEICPAQLTQAQSAHMQELAVRAFHALGLQVYARMDFILDEATGEAFCLEANALPGMTPTSLIPQEAAAAGIGYEALCDQVVRLSLKKYEVQA